MGVRVRVCVWGGDFALPHTAAGAGSCRLRRGGIPRPRHKALASLGALGLASAQPHARGKVLDGGCGGGLFLSRCIAARCRGVPAERVAIWHTSLLLLRMYVYLVERIWFVAALLPDVLVLLK